MASLTVNEMRAVVSNLYPGAGWKYRVNKMMKDNQIIAIYQSYLNRREKKKKKEEEEGHYVQLSLFDDDYGKRY